MRIKLFMLVIGLQVLSVGCSSTQKGQAVAPTPTVSPTQTSVVNQPAISKPESAEKKAGELACKRDQESRTLKVEALQPKGCKLWYSQHKNAVAWSSVGESHCEKVRSQIQEKLEVAGFKCLGDQVKSGPSPASTSPTKPAADHAEGKKSNSEPAKH